MASVTSWTLLQCRIDKYVQSFELAVENPDRWESEWLSKAIVELGRGDYARGEEALRQAELSRDERPQQTDVGVADVIPTAQHRVKLERVSDDRPR